MDFLAQAWPWYVGGPMIALVMFLLLWLGTRFGVSSSLESVCSISGIGKYIPYFNVDWRKRDWLLVFILGSIIGGAIAAFLIPNPEPINLSQQTIEDLEALGVPYDGEYIPKALFNWETVFTTKGLILLVGGGFLIGFGTRYAGGCTSGHAISGLSELQWPSLVATIGFFIGGLITTFLLLPLILS